MARPGWLDDSLEEEWVEPDELDMSVDHDDDDAAAHLSESVRVSPAPPSPRQEDPVGPSMSQFLAVGSQRQVSASGSSVTAVPSSPPVEGGTFLIREDIQHQPVTPAAKMFGGGLNKKGKGKQFEAFTKSIFSPLALEKMFEPPSPPQPRTTATSQLALQSPLIPLPQTSSPHNAGTPSRLQSIASSEPEDEADDGRPDEIVASDIPNLMGFNGRVPSARFTFHMSHGPTSTSTPPQKPFNRSSPARQTPTAKPQPDAARLKLFQTYDTYTKDHLSALVESIDVKSNAGSPSEDGAYGRSSKRIRLSPPERERPGTSRPNRPPLSSTNVSPQRAPLSRPNSRRDYLNESRSLMEQIKNNRSFSLTTTASVLPDAAALSLVDEDEEEAPPPVPAVPRALAYRLQAASLMAQIKSDMAGKENEDPRYGSSRAGTGTWSDVSSIRKSMAKMDITADKGEEGERSLTPEPERYRSGSPPTIVIEPNSPTEPLPELPLPLKSEPARESSISPRRTTFPFTASTNEKPSAPPSTQEPPASLPVPGAPEQSRTPSLSTVPSSTRFNTNGQRSGSGVSATSSSSIGSSTTATTATSQLSLGSNIKRAGSPRIRTIAPEEVGPITRVGDMQWDAVRMVWTKDRSSRNLNASRKRERTVDEDDEDDNDDLEGQDEDISEDVFRDIESLKDVTQTGSIRSAAHSRASSSASSARRSIVRQRSPSPLSDRDDWLAVEDDAREEFNQPVRVDDRDDVDGQFDSRAFESDDEFDTGLANPSVGQTASPINDEQDKFSSASIISAETSNADLQRNFESTFSDEEDSYPPVEEPPRPTPGTPFNPNPTPRPILIPSQSTPHPFPHSNPRSRPQIPLVAPRSVLKQTPSPFGTVNPATPATSGKYSRRHRRSVSFSDGRQDGKILNVSVSRFEHEEGHDDDSELSEFEDEIQAAQDSQVENSLANAQSIRARRIEGMLAALEEASVEDSTPSKSSLPHHRPDTSGLVPLSARTSTFSRSASTSAARSRSSSLSSTSEAGGSSVADPDITIGSAVSRRDRRDVSIAGNQTILTEASFAVTQDRLVQAITQVHPYEPHWENLADIDLSGFGLESVTKMKEYLPALVNLNLHNNQLAYLTGIPHHVRTLRASNNMLSSMTAYSHIQHLEYLDISNNSIESLTQLRCLSRLHDLRADGNRITDIEGLEEMRGLTKLSLKRNKIGRVDFGDYDWPRIESIDLSANCLTSVKGLSALQRLALLNLDHNKIASISSSKPLLKLRILRLSDNRLSEVHAAAFPHLRTFYLDGNRLRYLHDMDKLSKLENLSLRNQAGGHMQLAARDIQDVKRLYLSGNPLVDLSFLSAPCYNLVYLELAGCRISTLPPNLASTIPNVRVLNLNYNFIADVTPLCGLVRLKRLTLVGSRLKGTKTFLKALRNMPDVEMIDIRMNPSTLGWYLPLLVRDIPGALQPSESGSALPPLHPSTSDLEEEVDRTTYSAVRLHPFAAAASRMATATRAQVPVPKPKKNQNPTWEDLDSKFRRDLPNDSYLGRLSYRGLVMRACPKVQIIDGVRVSDGEREKAEQYLDGVLKARQQAMKAA